MLLPGRTIDILRLTLPTFFNTGLMTSWDPETGDAYPSPTLPSLPSLPHLPNLHLPHLPLPLHISPHPINKDAEKQTIGKRKERHERESIYSSRIRLAYTPPSPLPHPFPEKLTLDGESSTWVFLFVILRRSSYFILSLIIYPLFLFRQCSYIVISAAQCNFQVNRST